MASRASHAAGSDPDSNRLRLLACPLRRRQPLGGEVRLPRPGHLRDRAEDRRARERRPGLGRPGCPELAPRPAQRDVGGPPGSWHPLAIMSYVPCTPVQFEDELGPARMATALASFHRVLSDRDRWVPGMRGMS